MISHTAPPGPAPPAARWPRTDGPRPPAPPAVVSHATAMALRRALDAREDAARLDHRIRRAARRVAADAHAAGISADEMLSALEREWCPAVSPRRLALHGSARDFVGRLVTLCIHEFYAAPEH